MDGVEDFSFLMSKVFLKVDLTKICLPVEAAYLGVLQGFCQWEKLVLM